jgi:hypothetical protein
LYQLQFHCGLIFAFFIYDIDIFLVPGQSCRDAQNDQQEMRYQYAVLILGLRNFFFDVGDLLSHLFGGLPLFREQARYTNLLEIVIATVWLNDWSPALSMDAK